MIVETDSHIYITQRKIVSSIRRRYGPWPASYKDISPSTPSIPLNKGLFASGLRSDTPGSRFFLPTTFLCRASTLQSRTKRDMQYN